MPRPQVNLDPIAEVLDRVLAHPAARLAAELLPETHGAVRAVRDNLPAIASGIEARAVDHVRSEARTLERELTGAITRWVHETIAKGKGQRAPRRLRAPKRAAPKKGKRQ